MLSGTAYGPILKGSRSPARSMGPFPVLRADVAWQIRKILAGSATAELKAARRESEDED